MSPQTNGTPSPFARTGYFPAAPTPEPRPAARLSSELSTRSPDGVVVLPWWANGWLTKGFALMAGMIVMASLVFVSSLRAEQEAEGRGRSASTKSGMVSGRATATPNTPRNTRDGKATSRPRVGSAKSGVID